MLAKGFARSTGMTRRILDRQKLKRASEDSKRVLEQATRGRPGGGARKAPPWPASGRRTPATEPAPKKP